VTTPVVALLLVTLSSPCVDSFPLNQGEAASCDGLLVPEGQAVKALGCLTVELPRCKVDLDTTKRRALIVDGASAAKLEALNTHIMGCERALIEAASVEPRAWWDSPAMGFGAGVVVTAATVIALLFGQK